MKNEIYSTFSASINGISFNHEADYTCVQSLLTDIEEKFGEVTESTIVAALKAEVNRRYFKEYETSYWSIEREGLAIIEEASTLEETLDRLVPNRERTLSLTPDTYELD